MNPKPNFKPGQNMAMKVPPHEFDKTVAFYRDVLGLKEKETESSTGAYESVAFEFGSITLWIDKGSAASPMA